MGAFLRLSIDASLVRSHLRWDEASAASIVIDCDAAPRPAQSGLAQGGPAQVGAAADADAVAAAAMTLEPPAVHPPSTKPSRTESHKNPRKPKHLVGKAPRGAPTAGEKLSSYS